MRNKRTFFLQRPESKAKLRRLQDEAIKTANRIDLYDKQLLRLEATAPLKRVIERVESGFVYFDEFSTKFDKIRQIKVSYTKEKSSHICTIR